MFAQPFFHLFSLLPALFDLRPWLQALLFCATEPLTVEQISACLRETPQVPQVPEITDTQISAALETLEAEWQAAGMAFRVRAVAGGYQLLTEPAYQGVVEALVKQKARRRLSASMLETLAIIAYKQPVTRSAVEQIRGVGCDYAVQKLLEKELIELRGKAETVGRPVLYGTTARFLHGFGLNALRDLPQLRDVAADEDGAPAASAAGLPGQRA